MRPCLELLNDPNSGICVGLDPDISKIPSEYQSLPPHKAISRFLNEIIEITSRHATAFKLQKAFFELYEQPLLLKETIATIHKTAPNAPAIVDCKIGDIENTMRAYLENILRKCDADGIVINPYMGWEVFNALSDFPDRGIAVLVRTSNPGAGIIQDVPVKPKGDPLWSYVLEVLVANWNNNKNIIPVLSGYVDPERIRKIIPDNMPILYAGIGAQGGELTQITPLFNSKGSGVIVNSSRAITYPYESSDENWRDRVEESIFRMKYEISALKPK